MTKLTDHTRRKSSSARLATNHFFGVTSGNIFRHQPQEWPSADLGSPRFCIIVNAFQGRSIGAAFPRPGCQLQRPPRLSPQAARSHGDEVQTAVVLTVKLKSNAHTSAAICAPRECQGGDLARYRSPEENQTSRRRRLVVFMRESAMPSTSSDGTWSERRSVVPWRLRTSAALHLSADRGSHWDRPPRRLETWHRVNHSEILQRQRQAQISKMAGKLLSPLRRMVTWPDHQLSAQYSTSTGTTQHGLEDKPPNRQRQTLARIVVSNANGRTGQPTWKGYWQAGRRKPKATTLARNHV